jgi:alginate O-acetyltransferase complex protein AlgI
MIFNSIDFLIFFPLVTIIYFLLPHRFRWFHLLIASCVFYCFFIPKYLLILLFTIVIDYFAGIWIHKSTGRNKKIALFASIFANLGVLAVFKYVYFILGNVQSIFSIFGKTLDTSIIHIVLPIGLSFHTFQAMSYTFEIYKGNQLPERKFGLYALYVMFYPQLVAGPIERPQNVLPQFYIKQEFSHANMVAGLQQMLWGMFKKVVVADRLGILVDKVYKHPLEYQGMPLLVATMFFSIQIFCDFSGYSDIALGAAKTMGFDLMKNFDRPYYAKSMAEHWRRWHISLSTWFRDYLYIPLGGNRVSKLRGFVNILIVFTISGLWHGDKWHYIIWGALHGIYLVIGQITKKQQEKFYGFFGNGFLNKALQAGTTYFILLFAWVLFRSDSMNHVFYIFKNVLNFNPTEKHTTVMDLLSTQDWILSGFSFLILETVHWLQRDPNYLARFNALPRFPKWSFYYLLLTLILCFGVFNATQFIYFQF